MALNFMQTLQGEKVSKGRALQKFQTHFEFCVSFSPKKTENEQSLRRCSAKGMEVCSNIVLSDYTYTHVTGASLTARKSG